MNLNADPGLDLPALHHVGMVVLDLDEAASNFQRRWGATVTGITDITLHKALHHNRPAAISFRRGLICNGGSRIELIQPQSDSPFWDFLRERKGDGVHHLAYVVDEIDPYLERLKPTCAELVLDTRLAVDGEPSVLVEGFAHGPTIELVQRNTMGDADD